MTPSVQENKRASTIDRDRYGQTLDYDFGKLRMMLSELSGTPLPAGADWDQEAQAALKKFQTSERLPGTGFPDEATVALLNKRHASTTSSRAPNVVRDDRLEAERITADTAKVASDPSQVRTSSEYTPEVLRELVGEAAGVDLPPGKHWDAQAQAAMRQFQKASGLPETGQPDAVTVRVLNEHFEGKAGAAKELNFVSAPPSDARLEATACLVKKAAAAVDVVLQKLIPDVALRAAYGTEVKSYSDSLVKAVAARQMSPGEAVHLATNFRNKMMNMTRSKLSGPSLAFSKYLKAEGTTLTVLTEKYAQKLFNKPYTKLSAKEAAQVAEHIVTKAGTTNPAVNGFARNLPKGAKLLQGLGHAAMIAQVLFAEDKELALLKAVAGAAAFRGGAMLGGAAAPSCGPGAPVCAVALPLVFGFLASYAAEELTERTYRHVVKG
jgi:Putative peptidoglycan binding domain